MEDDKIVEVHVTSGFGGVPETTIRKLQYTDERGRFALSLIQQVDYTFIPKEDHAATITAMIDVAEKSFDALREKGWLVDLPTTNEILDQVDQTKQMLKAEGPLQ